MKKEMTAEEYLQRLLSGPVRRIAQCGAHWSCSVESGERM